MADSKGQWAEQLSPIKEKCNYCKRTIAPETSYFRRVFELDTADKPGVNICCDCVADSKEKTVQ